MTKYDKHSLSEETKEKIRADRSKGLTMKELAEKYYSSNGSIHRALKEVN